MSHTKGPWAWFGNASTNKIYLATTHSGRQYVMGFRRWGMHGAQPTFQPCERGLVEASELFEFAVGDQSIRGMKQAKEDGGVYRYDISGIDCDDARLIAAAPDLLEALQGAIGALEFSREYHSDLGNEEQDFAQSKLDLAIAAIAKATQS